MTKIELLNKQIEEIESLKTLKSFSPQFNAWERKTISLLGKIFGENSSQTQDLKKISYIRSVYSIDTPDAAFQKDYIDGLDNAKAILGSMVEELTEFNFEDNDGNKGDIDNPYLFILAVLNNFHEVARQLRNRREKRETLDVADEYDVQDLLHALLKVKFNDIRVEEWTPSYAGKSARMDTFIKDISVVIEIKKTRETLGEKEIGDQLIVDIERYKKHPDCKKLICFVYDPEGLIGNPAGLSSDLSDEGKDFSVEVIIEP